jgi:hypothetical protein
MDFLNSIPNGVYIYSICFLSVALLVLVLARIFYDSYKMDKIRDEFRRNTTAAIEQLRVDMREELAIGKIVDCTMIQKRRRGSG